MPSGSSGRELQSLVFCCWVEHFLVSVECLTYTIYSISYVIYSFILFPEVLVWGLFTHSDRASDKCGEDTLLLSYFLAVSVLWTEKKCVADSRHCFHVRLNQQSLRIGCWLSLSALQTDPEGQGTSLNFHCKRFKSLLLNLWVYKFREKFISASLKSWRWCFVFVARFLVWSFIFCVA